MVYGPKRRADGASGARRGGALAMAMAMALVLAMTAAACRHDLSDAADTAPADAAPVDAAADSTADAPHDAAADVVSSAPEGGFPDGPPGDTRPTADKGFTSGPDAAASDAACGALVKRGTTCSSGSSIVGGEVACSAGKAVRRATPTGASFAATCQGAVNNRDGICLADVPTTLLPRTGNTSAGPTTRRCPTGQTVVGGGCTCLDTAAILRMSAPTPAGATPTGWTCNCSTGDVTAVVVCAADRDVGCLGVRAVKSSSVDNKRASCTPTEVVLAVGCTSQFVTELAVDAARTARCEGAGVTSTYAICARRR